MLNKRKLLRPVSLQLGRWSSPVFELELKYQPFFDLKPANFSTEIYVISSLDSQAFWLELELKGDSGEISDGNKEHVGNYRGKVILVTKWQKAWPHLSLDVLWKVEFMNYKIGYLTEENFKQNIEGVAWCLLTHSKMWKETDELKNPSIRAVEVGPLLYLLSKKEPELQDLKSYPIHVVQREKENLCCQENPKGTWTTIW